MQRLLPSGITALISIITLSSAPACKDGEPQPIADRKTSADAQIQDAPAANAPAQDGGAAQPGAGSPTASAEAGAPTADSGAAESGAAVAPSAEAGAGAEAGAAAEAGAVEDVVPGLFAQVKSLDTTDEAAKTALADAIAAGASKIEAAKIANERGESLMADGEGERATVFFQWAADTHTLYSEPVYNLATLAAYAGDLEIAKGHLAELQKRGNKKLMKKVGVDPAFALLVDDPDVRKIYEQ